MLADTVLLEHDGAQAAPGQEEGGRAAMDATADDHDVGRAVHQRAPMSLAGAAGGGRSGVMSAKTLNGNVMAGNSAGGVRTSASARPVSTISRWASATWHVRPRQ